MTTLIPPKVSVYGVENQGGEYRKENHMSFFVLSQIGGVK